MRHTYRQNDEMTHSLVVDASVALKWFLRDDPKEPDCEAALDLLRLALQSEIVFFQPPHWHAEILAVLARKQPQDAAFAHDHLKAIDCIHTIDTPMVYHRAIKLANALDHHLFDTLYHAIALEENALFITADRRYYVKAKKLKHIALLSEITRSALGSKGIA